MDASTHKRSTSHTVPSRPTTPLRPSSRTSFRGSTAFDQSDGGVSSSANPFAALEPAFAELADGMADLEANFMHLQLMHESLARFSENFAAFLYGLNMNAFCVDFPEAPTADSFRRAKMLEEIGDDGGAGGGGGRTSLGGKQGQGGARAREDYDPDMTIVSTATSFVDHPSTVRTGSSFTTPAAQTRGRQSGIARGIPRAGAGGRGTGRTRSSGIARGTRGRGVR